MARTMIIIIFFLSVLVILEPWLKLEKSELNRPWALLRVRPAST